jgi:hypothetical protein
MKFHEVGAPVQNLGTLGSIACFSTENVSTVVSDDAQVINCLFCFENHAAPDV